MNIEAYNLDSIRKLVRDLQAENRELKELLDNAGISYAQSEVFEAAPDKAPEYDVDQGARILPLNINRKTSPGQFYDMFKGRRDVYAQRSKKGGYFPQCVNRWNETICPIQKGERKYCGEGEACGARCWRGLSQQIIWNHLKGYREDGADVIGVYPLLPDGTCQFLAFDFDNHEKDAEKQDYANTDDRWHEEVDALRMICTRNGIDALVERSRSGKGAHIWIFFSEPISAATVRNFGLLLLDKGMSEINLKTFRFYDRMFPSQDSSDSLGNLIALPLQGQALKSGNSVFVDENWNAYPDQWNRLMQTRKYTRDEVEHFILKWESNLGYRSGQVMFHKDLNRRKPWKRHDILNASDVTGHLHIVLADGVYVDALNLRPQLQNQIRALATISNPNYYKSKRMGYSVYGKFSMISLARDVDGYIQIPRGLLENLLGECKKSGISYEIEDHREKGRPIRVSFRGELRLQQDLSAQQMLSCDHGILSAATAFGKTVVGSYMIAQRKVNTLILLERTDLISQWQDAFEEFLVIDEEIPKYYTKTGRVKLRDGVVGTLSGGTDKLTGIVDIAMVGSLYKKGAFHEKLNSYGMVIMDECHHAAAGTVQEILKKVNAKYVYGVSATPVRADHLEPINYMLLGPIRYKYSALERAKDQGIDHLVMPRYTRVIDHTGDKKDINAWYRLICDSSVRNEQLIDDIRDAVSQHRTPVILAKYKEHAKMIYEKVRADADYVFLYYGDNTNSENAAIKKELKEISPDKSLILIATGQKIGEGFDFPRLDTLILAAPVSDGGRLEQYVGRLNRDYDGKENVIVYDYIDAHLPVFENMYRKRLRTYKRIGFRVISDQVAEKQSVNAIYDSGNYMDVFERDLVEAEREIVISSPGITFEKINRFIHVVKPRLEAGVKISVITTNPNEILYENAAFISSLIEEMREAEIHVKLFDGEAEHFAVIDQELVWHGGMNLLGKEEVWDNLIRTYDSGAASELLVMAFGSEG
ncbi:MAG: DEAD/DEAH box helicase family protein [Clostridiales bacterium]|nr:DEAD/DEAH box helicase family protein [Clostridiales bacterium]